MEESAADETMAETAEETEALESESREYKFERWGISEEGGYDLIYVEGVPNEWYGTSAEYYNSIGSKLTFKATGDAGSRYAWHLLKMIQIKTDECYVECFPLERRDILLHIVLVNGEKTDALI